MKATKEGQLFAERRRVLRDFGAVCASCGCHFVAGKDEATVTATRYGRGRREQRPICRVCRPKAWRPVYDRDAGQGAIPENLRHYVTEKPTAA